MLFSLMKAITWFLSPLTLATVGVLLGGYWVWRDHLRRGLWALALSVVWLWVWASPWFSILHSNRRRVGAGLSSGQARVAAARRRDCRAGRRHQAADTPDARC